VHGFWVWNRFFGGFLAFIVYLLEEKSVFGGLFFDFLSIFEKIDKKSKKVVHMYDFFQKFSKISKSLFPHFWPYRFLIFLKMSTF